MRRFFPLIFLLIGFVVVLTISGFASRPAQALPEYSAQVGEPCSSCHISPSGGGPRGVRGQAWIGSDKPGDVPLLEEALEILGVHLNVDPQIYAASVDPIPPAMPLSVDIQTSQDLYQRLSNFDGN